MDRNIINNITPLRANPALKVKAKKEANKDSIVFIICQVKKGKISEDEVKRVLLHPGQVVASYGYRKIAQDIVEYKGERFLLRSESFCKFSRDGGLMMSSLSG